LSKRRLATTLDADAVMARISAISARRPRAITSGG